MKKHRGLRRYYKNLATKNDFDKTTWLDFDNPDVWFDNWHMHFDWYGYGNESFKRRRPHLDKLFRHFELLADRSKSLRKDFQLYAMLLDHESADDSLFLNTENPNNKFPWTSLHPLSSENNLTNPELRSYVDALVGYKIQFGTAEENYCYITIDNIGLPVK